MTPAADARRLLTFRLGADLFAAPIESVQRVLRYAPPRALPDMPPWMEGVVEHDGVVPVLDLRRRFGLPSPAPGAQARLVVCSTDAGSAALVVDAVLDVRPVPPSELSEPPALFRGLGNEYLLALARRQGELVLVLDLERLLASQEPLAFEAAGGSSV